MLGLKLNHVSKRGHSYLCSYITVYFINFTQNVLMENIFSEKQDYFVFHLICSLWNEKMLVRIYLCMVYHSKVKIACYALRYIGVGLPEIP